MKDDRRLPGITGLFDGLAAYRCMRVFTFLKREFPVDEYVITSIADEVEELNDFLVFHTVQFKLSGLLAVQIGIYKNGTYFITDSHAFVADKLTQLVQETPGMMTESPV
jgi:hypothetical protein